MRFDAFQQMKMGQQMRLGPHMIQSMEILQMSMAELEERIEQELEGNATLEVVEPDGGAASPAEAPLEGAREDRPLDIGDKTGAHDFERLGSFEEENPEVAENAYEGRDSHERFEREGMVDHERAASGESGTDAKSEAMANTASRGVSVAEQLIDQWRMADVDASIRALGAHIVTFIEDDGYLRTPLETIAERAPLAACHKDGTKPTTAEVEHALKAVQLFLEPAGVGARDTRECLLLQIDARQEDSARDDSDAWAIVRRVVEQHLDDVANNRLPKVAQKLGVSLDDLKGVLDRLKTLRLAPGRQLSSEAPPGIVPDGIVEFDEAGERYIAYLNDRRLPNLRINEEYAKLAKDKTAPKETREFLKTNLGNAAFLIDAIEQRKRTLLRVLEAVVAAQRDFFDYGPQAIKPLPMTKVAEQLGVHVATVSRAVAEKYIQTPRGVVALRKFFTGGTTTDTGEEVSYEAIKAVLLDVIDKEDKKNPLSDDALAEELKKAGFDIARRTVAKYRGQLNIPTGRLRKAH